MSRRLPSFSFAGSAYAYRTIYPPASSLPAVPGSWPGRRKTYANGWSVDRYPSAGDALPLTAPTATGQLQFGPNFVDYWSGEDAFLNALAIQNPKHLRANFGSFFDEATGEISGVPAGGPYNIGWLRFSREIGAPEDYFDRTYFIEWEGDADLRVASFNRTGVELTDLGGNRKRLDIPAGHVHSIRVQVHSVGARPLKNWRAYEARYEARVLAGEIYRPEFLDVCAPYDVIRPMNWSSAGSTRVNRASQLASIPHPARGELVPLDEQIRLAMDTGAELWINVPPALGAPDEVTTEAFLDPPEDPSNPAALWQQQQDFWRAKGVEHAATVLASDEFLEFARLLAARLDALGYPPDRPIHIELGNEIWNFGAGFMRQYFYYLGIGSTIAGGIGPMGALGYRLTKLALAIEQAWDEASSTRPWNAVFGAQTANAQTTKSTFGGNNGVLDGCDEYFNSISATDPTAKARIAPHIAGSTTNYLEGAFNRINFPNNLYNDQNPTTYFAAMEAEIQSDPAGLSQRIVDLITTQTEGRGIAWVLARIQEHVDALTAWGAKYLGCYEGSSHDTYYGDNPVVQAFATSFFQSAYNAEILRDSAEKFFAAHPGKIFSDFNGTGRPEPNRAWIEGPPGVETPARAVWAEIAATLV